jgi:hypothetical protein
MSKDPTKWEGAPGYQRKKIPERAWPKHLRIKRRRLRRFFRWLQGRL